MSLHTWATALALSLAAPTLARATIIAADAASDPAYALAAASWQGANPTADENPTGTDNGGFGFDVWNFAGGYHNPARSPYGRLNHFVDGVDFPASSFNDLGAPAFGLTNANQAFFDYTARATRTFAPLQVGNTLSVDFDNPLLAPLREFSPAGFLFRLNAGGGPVINSDPIPGVAERFGLTTTSDFNSERWFVTDADEFTDSGLASSETSTGATFRFTLHGAETYTAELLRISDGQVLFSRSASLKNAGAGPIDSLEITLYGHGSGDALGGTEPTGEREFFFDNLSIESDSAGANDPDFNVDGRVDGEDYLAWQRGYGIASGAEHWQGDANGDGAVDGDDGNMWSSQFGNSVTQTLVARAVPEPASEALTLIFAAAPALGAGRRSWAAPRFPDAGHRDGNAAHQARERRFASA